MPRTTKFVRSLEDIVANPDTPSVERIAAIRAIVDMEKQKNLRQRKEVAVAETQRAFAQAAVRERRDSEQLKGLMERLKNYGENVETQEVSGVREEGDSLPG